MQELNDSRGITTSSARWINKDVHYYISSVSPPRKRLICILACVFALSRLVSSPLAALELQNSAGRCISSISRGAHKPSPLHLAACKLLRCCFAICAELLYSRHSVCCSLTQQLMLCVYMTGRWRN
jgi:hypothetical protein